METLHSELNLDILTFLLKDKAKLLPQQLFFSQQLQFYSLLLLSIPGNDQDTQSQIVTKFVYSCLLDQDEILACVRQ